MKQIIKIISQCITNLVISAVISTKVASVLSKYCNNVPLSIALYIVNFIATWTLTDVIVYLIEMAYEHGDLTLCEAAETIEKIKNSKKLISE